MICVPFFYHIFLIFVIPNPSDMKKRLLVWSVVVMCCVLLAISCKKKEDTSAPVVNTYTVKYQVRYVGCPATTPFVINYVQHGENKTAFVALGTGELQKYWNLEFTAQTGEYVYLKCTPPFPPVGYTTLCDISIEATPASPAFYLQNTASYPAFAEVQDTLP